MSAWIGNVLDVCLDAELGWRRALPLRQSMRLLLRRRQRHHAQQRHLSRRLFRRAQNLWCNGQFPVLWLRLGRILFRPLQLPGKVWQLPSKVSRLR